MHKIYLIGLKPKKRHKRPDYTKKWDKSPHSSSFKRNDQLKKIREYEIKCYIREVSYDG